MRMISVQPTYQPPTQVWHVFCWIFKTPHPGSMIIRKKAKVGASSARALPLLLYLIGGGGVRKCEILRNVSNFVELGHKSMEKFKLFSKHIDQWIFCSHENLPNPKTITSRNRSFYVLLVTFLNYIGITVCISINFSFIYFYMYRVSRLVWALVLKSKCRKRSEFGTDRPVEKSGDGSH